MESYYLEKLKIIQNFAKRQYDAHHDIATISVLLDELVNDIIEDAEV